jgi:TetR/AcrR family transcriptional repressor of nem operon
MKETRDQIIGLADDLIRKKGFNAFSYSDIAAILDIRNAAVHYHFPTKSDLGKAVMEKEMQRLRLYRWRNKELAGDLQIKHLVETFYCNAQLHTLCLMGALTPEIATFDPGMQTVLQQMCTTIRDWVAECLEQARGAGRLRFEGTAADRAALVVSTLLSSLLLARVEGEALFQRMLDRLLEDLGADWRIAQLPRVHATSTRYHSFT